MEPRSATLRIGGLGAAAMSKLNRAELDHLENRELQLTILAAVFVLVLAAGLAAFMYPLVFVHPEGNKWTLRVAFFGFCALTLLFVGYLVDRQRMVRKLKQHLLEELERNVELRHQASVDLLQSMPDINHFWDRLTMEFRRAVATEKTLSLLLVKAAPGQAAGRASVDPASWGDAAKAISRKLRPTDSIYRLSTDLFGVVCRKRIRSTPNGCHCACRKSCRWCARNSAAPTKSIATTIRSRCTARTNSRI